MGRRDKSRASTKKKRGGKLQQQSPGAPIFRFDGDANQPEPDQVQPPVVGDPAPVFRFGSVPNNAQVTQTKSDVSEPDTTSSEKASVNVLN